MTKIIKSKNVKGPNDKVTRNQFCKLLAEKTGKTEKESKSWLNSFFQSIEEILTDKDQIKIIGSMNISVANRKDEFIKPGTQEKVKTKYPYSIKMRIGKTLKEKINEARLKKEKKK